MFIESPEKFAALFNENYPGTHRQITARDVGDMTRCCLIGRYGYYFQDDLELVRGLLQYEQLRENQRVQPTLEDKQEPPKCKKCKQPLPYKPSGKKGRPREYRLECEPFINRNRQRELSDGRRKLRNKFTPTKTSPSLRQLNCEPRQ